MFDVQFAQRVGERLLSLSDQFASFSIEHPGYIDLRTEAGGVWEIGTANGYWGGDLSIFAEDREAGGVNDYSIRTSIGDDSPLSAESVADALFAEMCAIGQQKG